jgi:nucleotide-binding universal stress UspA family protein
LGSSTTDGDTGGKGTKEGLEMAKQGPVLAATTMDAASDHALREAAASARSRNVRLHVCHVLPELYGHHPLFPQLRDLDRVHFEQIREAVELAIRKQLERVLDKDQRAQIHLEAGSPHTEILRLAENIKPSLLVVGAPADKVGEIAERVVRHAPCPVLVAIRHSGKVVLAATDFSDPALPAVHAAVEEARRRRKPCYVLHSVDFVAAPNMLEMGGFTVSRPLMDTVRADARKKLEEVGAQLGAGVETLLDEGPASDAILARADELDAELIVLGTHGRSGLRRLALGSVAEIVLRRGRCSMLVVRLASKERSGGRSTPGPGRQLRRVISGGSGRTTPVRVTRRA